MKCINKFFYDKLPEMQAISKVKKLQNIFPTDINSLGVEGALEACIGLFEDGRLNLVADNIKNFLVYILEGKKLMVIYEIDKGKRLQ